MADISREIRIAFEGDDRVSGVIKGISGGLDSFASKVQGVTQPLADMADKVLLIEGALGALAIGGLAYATKKSIEWETAVVSLSKILSDQEKEVLPEVQREVLNLSDQYGQSAVSFLGAATDYRKAGFEINETTGLLKESANLVIAAAEADLDLGAATEYIIATLKGFKAPAEDAGRLVDVLNKVSNEYATSVTELAIGMSKLSPVASKMGFSFEETAAVLTPVIEIFRSGDEASTALRTGLLKLVDDAKPVQDGLEALGISQRDANGALKSGKEILYEVAAAFQTADENDKLFLAAQLVGIRQAAKMVEVFDGLSYSTEILGTAMGATGSRLTEVEARLNTAQVAVDRFKVGFENLAIIVGETFRDASKNAIDGATLIETTLQDLVEGGAFDPLLDFVEEFATDIGDLLATIAKNLPEAFANIDFSGLLDSIKGVGGEIQDLFKAFFGDIDLSTAEGLTEFIQKVIDGFTALTNVTRGILDALEPFVRKLGEMVDQFVKSGPETQEFVGQILGMGKAINTILNNIGLLTGALDLLAASIGLLAITRVPALLTQLGLMGSATTTLIGLMGKFTIAAAAFGAGWVIGDKLAETFPVVDQFGRGIADIALSFSGLDQKSIEFIEDRAKETESAGKAAVAMVQLAEQVGAIPPSHETKLEVGSAEWQAEYDRILKQIQDLPEEKKVQVGAEADQESVEYVKNYIEYEIFEHGERYTVKIPVEADESSITEAKSKLDEIPSEKITIAKLENETQYAIAQMKEEFSLLQTSLELKAKLDIVEAQEHAENFRSTVDAIQASFENTGDVILGLASGLEDLSTAKFYEVIRLMEAESNRREKLLAVQIEQAQVEIAYTKAKTDALEKGEGFITIKMDGVYPELQLVMAKIIEMTQIATNQEGLEYLLGL